MATRLGNDRPGTWTLNTTPWAPTTLDARYSDLIIVSSTLRVSQASSDTHYIWDGTSWTNFAWTSAVASRRHHFVSFARRLYMTTDFAIIVGIDEPATSYSADVTLDLKNPTKNTISFIVAKS